jgi:large subunit ribosomal protein L19
MSTAVQFVHEQLTGQKEFPKFKAGDNVTVNYKIVEGGKERIQSFRGDVIKRQGTAHTATFTVRKISDSVGVERTFPIYSPNIDSIEVNQAVFAGLSCSSKEVVAVRVPVSRRKEELWLLYLRSLNSTQQNNSAGRVIIRPCLFYFFKPVLLLLTS